MSIAKQTRTPESITCDFQHEIDNALKATYTTDSLYEWLQNANEQGVITDMQEAIADYLDGQLQPILDEYHRYQQQEAKDAQDTIEHAYRQAHGM